MRILVVVKPTRNPALYTIRCDGLNLNQRRVQYLRLFRAESSHVFGQPAEATLAQRPAKHRKGRTCLIPNVGARCFFGSFRRHQKA